MNEYRGVDAGEKGLLLTTERIIHLDRRRVQFPLGAGSVAMAVLLVAGIGCAQTKAPLAETAAPSAVASSSPPKAKAYGNPKDEELGTLPPGIGLELGSPMPQLSINNAAGEKIDLTALASKGTLLLVFYRGGWCPFCNFQIRELSSAFAEFQGRGVTPVAISVDRMDEAAKTAALYKIPFPVLSDPDLVAHDAFRITRQAGEEEFQKLKSMGLDLEAASGKKHHRLAVPSVFVIEGGVIKFAHAELDYKKRPSLPQLLQTLDHLKR